MSTGPYVQYHGGCSVELRSRRRRTRLDLFRAKVGQHIQCHILRRISHLGFDGCRDLNYLDLLALLVEFRFH
jgi:hypothetical protein